METLEKQDEAEDTQLLEIFDGEIDGILALEPDPEDWDFDPLSTLCPDDAAIILTAMDANETARGRLGFAGREALKNRMFVALRWAEEHFEEGRGTPRERFLRIVVDRAGRRFREQFSRRGLREEYEDEKRIDAACADERALTSYLEDVHDALLRERPGKRHWRIPGYSDEDFAGEVRLALLGMARAGRDAFRPHEKAACAATDVFIDRFAYRLRRKRFISEALTPRRMQELLEGLRERYPTPEELVLRKNTGEAARRVRERAKAMLSRTQRRWLDAFELDVATHDDINYARVAETFGHRNRSSAMRAVRAIAKAFRAAGAHEVLDNLPQTPRRRAQLRLVKNPARLVDED